MKKIQWPDELSGAGWEYGVPLAYAFPDPSLGRDFPSTDELRRKATHGHGLQVEIVERVRAAGAVRRDFEVDDLPMLLEQIAAVRLGDERRTRALRHRYLALILDALKPECVSALPEPGPTSEELRARWQLD